MRSEDPTKPPVQVRQLRLCHACHREATVKVTCTGRKGEVSFDCCRDHVGYVLKAIAEHRSQTERKGG